MTTSSRKGMLPVRLGIEPDNETALSKLNLDPNLAKTMTDKQLNEYVIEKECERIRNWYENNDKKAEGISAANDYKRQAMQRISKA